jgi:RNA polymerase sigma factor (sigma-70 family)
MDPVRVLYVEDEEDYQLLVRRILGKEGFNLDIAGSGSDGLTLLQTSRPDLLILDVNLPDTDGYTLCRQIRNEPAIRDIPILMLTVRRRPEEWLKGFSAGVDDYVAKPLNPAELVQRVRTCLDVKRESVPAAGSPEYLLIQAAIAGNQSAYEVLIRQYRDRLTESLRASGKSAADADDLASVTFMKAYERLKQFKGQSSFYTWVYRIAFNEWGHFKRGKESASLDGMAHGDDCIWPASLTEPDRLGEDTTRKHLHAQVRRAVSYVPKPYRQMLQWHFIQGVPCETMARRLNIPSGTVMSRLFKARALLREAWAIHGAKRQRV